MRFALTLLLLGSFAACAVDLVAPSDRMCDELHPCQPGQWCRVDACTSVPPDEWDEGKDAGTDAGTDAGSADSGTPDGGSDAGVDAGVVVTVLPETWAMLTGAQKAFTIQVSGTLDARVTWDYSPNASGGSIDSAGLFTAPSVPGTYAVTATSVADPTRSASAVVTVQNGPPTNGLIVHFSADRLLGDGVALPADGALVSSWKDLSGNGHHLTQATSAFQPVFKASGVKGLPTVVFDGRDDRLSAPAFSQVFAQPNSVVLVFRSIDKYSTFVDSTVSSARHRLKAADLGAAGWTMQMIASGFAQPAQRPLMVGSFVRSIHIFDGVNSRQRFNNQDPAQTSYANLGTAGLGGIQLGLRQDNTPDDADPAKTGPAEIAEVLVYDQALDAGEISLIEAYLSQRYAP